MHGMRHAWRLLPVFFLLLCCCLLLAGTRSNGQIITTIAGTGVYGYSGDGGYATSAQISVVRSMALDAAGNLYLADDNNSRVRKVGAAGIITTIAGTGALGSTGNGGPATAASFWYVKGIAIDGGGNIYISDTGEVRKINTAGIISRYAGTGSMGFGGDGGPATAAGIGAVTAIAVDRYGNLYFAENDIHSIDRLRKVSASGIISTIAGGGTPGFGGDGGAATAAQISSRLSCVATDAAGNLYFSDYLNARVRKISTAGIITTVAGDGSRGIGGDGGPATAAQTDRPECIAVDAAGNLYIGDNYSSLVRKVNTAGIISTIAGSAIPYTGSSCAATARPMSFPFGLATDIAGNIYVSAPFRVLKISPGHAPVFSGGRSQVLTVCGGVDSLNLLLAITDSDVLQTETWAVVQPPVHGTVSASYASTSGIGTLTPVGMWYAATPGYTGTDSFRVAVTDCGGAADTTTIHITASPPPVTGVLSICPGGSTTLSASPPGGTWSSPGYGGIVTTGSATGSVTGIAAGTAVIVYTLATGCGTIATVTVQPLPPVPGAPASLCAGATTTVTDAAAGGLWTTTGYTGSVTIGSASGVVTGVSPGTVVISYTLPTGCSTSIALTVDPLPSAGSITGGATVCVGGGTTLGATVPGGVWGRSNTNAAITPGGLVTGLVTGIDTIGYSVTNGCGTATATKTIFVSPAAVTAGTITGPGTVCVGASILLTDAAAGGVWRSPGYTALVMVDSVTGSVTGISAGTAIISYRVATACGTATAVKIVTVNPLPIAGTITGGTGVCVSMAITLADASPGGLWSTSNSNATVVAGLVTGILAGSTVISYAVINGCGTATATKTIAINTTPYAGVITGAPTVCVGATTLYTGIAGGIWSAASGAVASVGTLSGIVSGVATGSAIISYTVANGCGTATTTKTITVTPLPSAGTITGAASACAAATTTLANATTGGVWSSSNTATASVSSTGTVSGIAAGTATISYAVTNGCGTATATKTLAVNAAPYAGTITGAGALCAAATTTLSNTTTGGAWSSSNTAVASINSTGTVHGVAVGTATISYAVTNGCGTATTTTSIAINALPVAGTITGSGSVCAATTTVLANGTTGGIWSSSNTAVAIITSAGIVSGITPGTATIYYAVTNGCGTATATKTLAVNAGPYSGTITGATATCVAATTALSDVVAGGTWASSNTAIASVNSAGAVSGRAAGTATISYTVVNGCGAATTTTTITVNALPFAGTITGAAGLCVAATTTLADGTTGGVWSSSNMAIASVNSAGTVSGIAAGTATINYAVTNGCGTAIATKTISVDPLPVAGTIGGTMAVCVGTTGLLSSTATGGAWSTADAAIASISTTGTVRGNSAGTTMVNYVVTNGCGTAVAAATVTVSPYPSSITGTARLCAGSISALHDTASGGVWSSSNVAVASINPTTGMVSGVAGGTATIMYTSGACAATIAVTIDRTPAPIAGVSDMCAWGAVMHVTDADTGGAWNSTGVTITATGTATSHAPGPATIAYVLSTGCLASATLMVNPLPLPVTGGGDVCMGSTRTVADGTAGGSWSSSNTAVGTVTTTGIVTGVTAGVTGITYTLPTGCAAGAAVRVVAPPVAGTITGAGEVCVGSTILLSDAAPGGVWTHANSSTTINTTGLVTGMMPGTDTISYIVSNVCGTATATATITTVAPPDAGALTGAGTVCVNATTIVAASASGGVWGSTGLHATVAGGVITGRTAGPDTVFYTVTNVCGSAVSKLAVDVLPQPDAGTIIGADTICTGATTQLASTSPGGVWSSSATGVADVGSGGVVTGIAGGQAHILYSVTNSCGVATAERLVYVLGVGECNMGVAVREGVEYGVRVYPNPNKGEFIVRVSCAKNEQAEIVICDVAGRQVMALRCGTNEDVRVRIGQPGVYVLRVVTGGMVEEVRVVVIGGL